MTQSFYCSLPLATHSEWQHQGAIHLDVGGKEEEVFRVECRIVALRLGDLLVRMLSLEADPGMNLRISITLPEGAGGL